MAVILAFIVASIVAFAAPLPAGPIIVETTLCAVMARPEAFNGRLVRFRAGVMTDWQHATVLVHSGCQHGMALSSTNAVPSNESQNYDEAVGTPLTGGRDRTVMATFTGRFSLRGSERQGAFDNSFEFNAQRIQHVEVYPKKHAR